MGVGAGDRTGGGVADDGEDGDDVVLVVDEFDVDEGTRGACGVGGGKVEEDDCGWADVGVVGGGGVGVADAAGEEA